MSEVKRDYGAEVPLHARGSELRLGSGSGSGLESGSELGLRVRLHLGPERARCLICGENRLYN